MPHPKRSLSEEELGISPEHCIVWPQTQYPPKKQHSYPKGPQMSALQGYGHKFKSQVTHPHASPLHLWSLQCLMPQKYFWPHHSQRCIRTTHTKWYNLGGKGGRGQAQCLNQNTSIKACKCNFSEHLCEHHSYNCCATMGSNWKNTNIVEYCEPSVWTLCAPAMNTWMRKYLHYS